MEAERIRPEYKELSILERLRSSRETRMNELVETTVERLGECGIKSIEKEMQNLDPRFLKEVTGIVEDFFEKYPECNGFLTSFRVSNLPKGVFARTGPRLNKEGEFIGAEMEVSKKIFGKSNYELKIVDLESDLNWRGERFLAGKGTKGVITHEMAHALALRLNAEDAGIQVGEKDIGKYLDLQKRYYYNSRIVSLCNNAIKDLNISPCDIGRELSTYASSDFGETFSEGISRYETCKNPGRLSTEIHDRYEKLIEERGQQG